MNTRPLLLLFLLCAACTTRPDNDDQEFEPGMGPRPTGNDAVDSTRDFSDPVRNINSGTVQAETTRTDNVEATP